MREAAADFKEQIKRLEGSKSELKASLERSKGLVAEHEAKLQKLEKEKRMREQEVCEFGLGMCAYRGVLKGAPCVLCVLSFHACGSECAAQGNMETAGTRRVLWSCALPLSKCVSHFPVCLQIFLLLVLRPPLLRCSALHSRSAKKEIEALKQCRVGGGSMEPREAEA